MCFLRLDAVRMSELLALEDMPTLTDREYFQFLRQHDIVHGLLAFDDGVPEGEDEGLPASGDAVLAREEAAPELVSHVAVPRPLVRLRPRGRVVLKISPEDPGVKIYFDKGSHTSGRPRAWTCCPNDDHPYCEKYKFLHQFPSERSLKVWLYAWSTANFRHADKYGHLGFVPTVATLAELDVKLKEYAA